MPATIATPIAATPQRGRWISPASAIMHTPIAQMTCNQSVWGGNCADQAKPTSVTSSSIRNRPRSAGNGSSPHGCASGHRARPTGRSAR